MATNYSLPPISSMDNHHNIHHSSNPHAATTLPSINALISHPERMMTPAASKAVPYQPQHVSPASPRAVYNAPLEQYRSTAQQHGPPSVYSARSSSVSPTGPHTYSHQRYPSTHDFPKREPVEHTAYLTPQSPRRMSYTQAPPLQVWPAQVPQNYVFTAQNAPPAGPPAYHHAPHLAQPAQQTPVPMAHPVQHPYTTPAQRYQEPAEHDVKRQKMVTHPEEVNNQLENFDLEAALIHISDRSKTIHEFSHHYCQRAHQTQRSGPLPGSTPNLTEIEAMLRHGNEIHSGLCRLHEVISLQQAALAERSREQMQKVIVNAPAEDVYAADQKDSLNGIDNKKRRGRAAPPGRCHSCNRAETPEWRRGPDGARTLCNACGLHYAKLTRKMGAKSAAALPLSSLRKSIDNGDDAI